MKMRIIVDEMPASCKECPFYLLRPYSCHNERGYECDCTMGFMKGRDMRDQKFSDRVFENCGLQSEVVQI